MARYTEDQQLYEAVITDMVGQDKCVVVYTEYGNEEEQLLANLLPAFIKQVTLHSAVTNLHLYES